MKLSALVVVLLLHMASTAVWAVPGRLECPEADAGDIKRKVDVDGDGVKDHLVVEESDDQGNAWQTWCCEGRAEFCVRFEGNGGNPKRFVGRCLYFGGHNTPELDGKDANKNGKKDAFTQIEFHNRDDINRSGAASKTRNDYDNETTFDQRDCFYKYCPAADKLLVCTTLTSQNPANNYRETGYFDNCNDTTVDHPVAGLTIDNCKIFAGNGGGMDNFPGAAGDAMQHCKDKQGAPRRPSGNGGAPPAGGVPAVADTDMLVEPPFALALTSSSAGTYEYAIVSSDAEPTTVTAGDQLVLSQMVGVNDAMVSSALALPANGGWIEVTSERTSNSVTFQATANAVLPSPSTVGAFRIVSSSALVGLIGWVSDGLAIGFQGTVGGPVAATPVPATSSGLLSLLGLGLLALAVLLLTARTRRRA